MMSFSRLLAAVPLLFSLSGLISTVDARWPSRNINHYSFNGSAMPIPADYTVPLSPNEITPGTITNETLASLPSVPDLTFALALPPPPANLTLKYVILARGVWNYTCANSSVMEPESLGGLFTLYDLAPIMPYLNSEADLHKIPALAVNVSSDHIQEVFNLNVIGNFYHTGPHTAVMDLGKKGYFIGGSLGILVPSGPLAPKGPEGSGALGWLIGVADAGSVGIEQFYRVAVAGGVEPPTCEGRPFMNAKEMAAEFWVYV